MQIYYPDLTAIQQMTMQLENELCINCGKDHQLVSHGFIYKKIATSTEPVAVGKRTICSKRYGRTGCGRTMQLYLNSRVRYLHYAGCCVVAFACLLMAGVTISQAYQKVTGIKDPRNAYRWLNKIFARLIDYRSLSHQPRLDAADNASDGVVQPRRRLLASTFRTLLGRFGEPLCACYQHVLQSSFL